MNHELPDVQAGFRKGRGTRDQFANISWIAEKVREFQENKTKQNKKSASLTLLLTVWITTNCGEFLKRWEYQTPYLSPEKPVCRSKSNNQNLTRKNGLVQN